MPRRPPSPALATARPRRDGPGALQAGGQRPRQGGGADSTGSSDCTSTPCRSRCSAGRRTEATSGGGGGTDRLQRLHVHAVPVQVLCRQADRGHVSGGGGTQTDSTGSRDCTSTPCRSRCSVGRRTEATSGGGGDRQTVPAPETARPRRAGPGALQAGTNNQYWLNSYCVREL